MSSRVELLILVHTPLFSAGLLDYFKNGKYSFSTNLNYNRVSFRLVHNVFINSSLTKILLAFTSFV